MLGGKKSGNKKPVKRKKLEEKTARELVKVADTWWSKYIRLRDSKPDNNGNRVGTCITCSKKLYVISDGRWYRGQNGHFITRGIIALRFDERNCWLQCEYDNAWRDKDDMTNAYAKALGSTADELRKLAKQPDAYKLPSKQYLLDLIAECKAYVEKALD